MNAIKPKAPYKIVVHDPEELKAKTLGTMKKIARVVGGTLGPGGRPVLIERQEIDLPPQITKDGVTVFRALGFRDAVEQAILETARDASVRTAAEAGDGTTTATILADSFTYYTHLYCENNPKIPAIHVIKKIQNVLKEKFEPLIEANKITCDLGSEEGRKLLKSVAKLSANGDEELADAVMSCFDICGDEGNVTIVETSGPTSCKVDQIQGFPVAMGYEESAAKYYPMFVNDPATQRIIASKPIFLLYFGRVTDIQSLLPAMKLVADGLAGNYMIPFNVVVVAVGFSENVLAQFAHWTALPNSINVYPLVIPQSPLQNGQKNFLDDLAAVTGATIFDQLSKPLETCILDAGDDNRPWKSDFGNLCLTTEEDGNGQPMWDSNGVTSFECGRYRSTVLGFCDEENLKERIDIVKKQVSASESELETALLNERVARLTGGIAKLNVIGSSNGELKERRDRAEDAVCAVRSALKAGALVGGGWMLAKLIDCLDEKDPIEQQVIKPALWAPIEKLYQNAGLPTDKLEKDFVWGKIQKLEKIKVRDISKNEMVNALECGILDSLPALREAVRNSISIATVLGTVNGCIVQPRDEGVDRVESKEKHEWDRNSQFNPADERG
jgi:chaperonin GroEL